MNITLTGTNGEGVEVFGEPQDASEFVQGVVNSRWQTRYQAISGSLKNATVTSRTCGMASKDDSPIS